MIPNVMFSQDINNNPSYKVELKDVSLSRLLDTLEMNYRVQFSYASNLLENETFSLKTNTADLSDILDEITAIYPLEYQILENKSILLRDRLLSDVPFIKESIKIQILDDKTNRPLSEVAVGIKGTVYGDYSNEEGIVSLGLPSGFEDIVLDVHLLGYQSEIVSCDEDMNQLIRLKPQSFMVEEVMIKDRMDVVKINATDHHVELSTSHITSLTSGLTGKDVLRQAQLLPGVASFDDVSVGLKIRGAEEESSLIILDDIPIYNASHYYGLFSAINPSYASGSTLYKNNLPVSYDGKTAGMLQINGPKADSNKYATGSIDVNLLTISGAASFPLAQNLSWTIAGRTSYQNVSDTDFFSLFNSKEQEIATVENFSLSSRDKLLSTVPGFTFYDLNSKLLYQWKGNKLEFNYYQSSDDLDDIFENEFKTRRQQIEILNNEFYNNSEDWKNRGFNFKLDYAIAENMTLSSTAYYTHYNNISGLEISLSRQFLRENIFFSYNNFRENTVKDLGLKNTLKYNGDDLDVNVGVELVDHTVGMSVFEQGETISENKSSDLEASAYVSLIPRLESKLNLEVGLRGTLFNQKLYPSPRLNVSYPITDSWSIKTALGRHNQYVRQISFENIFGRNLDFWILANERGIEVSKADQAMLGAIFKKGRFSLDIEAYYRYRYDILELALFNPRFDEASILPISKNNGNTYRTFTGDSRTYGVDIFLGYTYPKYSGWLAYTLSKSETMYDQILHGTPFPSQDDRRHQVKFINEYKVNNFTIGANLIYASGRPYTDLNKVATTLKRDELRPIDRISRLPAYIRTDFGITYGFGFKDSKLEIGLTAYNLLNRENVNYIQYLFSIPTNSDNNPNATINTLLGTESNLLSRTVNLNLSYKF